MYTETTLSTDVNTLVHSSNAKSSHLPTKTNIQQSLNNSPIPEDSYLIDENELTMLIMKFDPTISAFRRCSQSSITICDACGIKGHDARKYFRRGIAFLPRDQQRHIIAWNDKYGTTPDTDTSPDGSRAY